MAKGTIFLLFFLTVSAVFLLGVNLGKNIERENGKPVVPPSPTPTVAPASPQASQGGPTSPVSSILPTLVPTTQAPEGTTIIPPRAGISIFKNNSCGFEFSYQGSYLKQKTVNEQSIIFSDPNDSSQAIAATCATEIPKPTLPPEKIETITLDGVTANLYHDQSMEDGSPRDEVIVRHPTNDKEIMIAGYGSLFQKVLSSFKFVR